MGDKMIAILYSFKLKNRSGSALAMVIIVFLIVSILLSSVFILSASNTKQVTTQEQGIHSEYIARSGAEAMFEFLITVETSRLAQYDTWANPYITDESVDFSEGEASVTVDKTTYDGRKRVRITSIGKADGSNITKKAVLEFDLVGYGNVSWSR